jgi:hypothetical protein
MERIYCKGGRGQTTKSNNPLKNRGAVNYEEDFKRHISVRSCDLTMA